MSDEIIHFSRKVFPGDDGFQEGLKGRNQKDRTRSGQEGIKTGQALGDQIRLRNIFPEVRFFIGREIENGIGFKILNLFSIPLGEEDQILLQGLGLFGVGANRYDGTTGPAPSLI
jgi:hypothetical protein